MSAEEAPAPSKVFSRQLREVRDRRGWSQQTLADQVKELGGALDRVAIAKIEGGRRGISLDEALFLAVVLQVNPTDLFIPRSDSGLIALSPGVAIDGATARKWAVGDEPLPGQDDSIYRLEVSERKLRWLTFGGPWFDRRVHEITEGLLAGRLSDTEAAKVQTELFREFLHGSPTQRLKELARWEEGESVPEAMEAYEAVLAFKRESPPPERGPAAPKRPRRRKATEDK